MRAGGDRPDGRRARPEANALQPDLLFIGPRRLAQVVTEDNIQGAPDLVVEVLSDGTAARDLGVKLRVYARHGVRFYWVVDPRSRTVRVFEGEAGGYREAPALQGSDRLVCPLFPGVSAVVSERFAD